MPRENTDTSMCGASVRPSPNGSAPGFTVTILKEPSRPVGQRPKPRNALSPSGTGPRGSSGCANRPSEPACQVSMRPSGIGSPAPSYRRPKIVIAPGVPSGTTNGPCSQGSRIAKYGPTVWDGVRSSLIVRSVPFWGFEDSGLAAAQDDVEPVAQRPLGLGVLDRELGDHPLLRRLVGHRVEDRVQRQQRVAREVHLGDQPLGERAAEQREV